MAFGCAGADTSAAPRAVCILRLSALGDCANVVPMIRTLQAAWPDIEISWIINRAEAHLVADLPGELGALGGY